jgi:putative transposase
MNDILLSMKENSQDLVEFPISSEKLNTMVRELEKVAKKVNRLYFIQQLYKGHSVREACSILNIPVTTSYNWLKKWNEEGPDGLNHKKGAGRPTFINESQMKEVDEFIRNNGSLGTKDVHYFIQKRFEIDYSLKQIRFIINKRHCQI